MPVIKMECMYHTQNSAESILFMSRDPRYLFDIFLGPSYNHAAPQVKYMTVCLSALWGMFYAHVWSFRLPEANIGLTRTFTRYAISFSQEIARAELFAGRQSLPFSPGDVAGSWMDTREVDTPAGISISFSRYVKIA